MKKILSFSFSLLGSSSLALASIPFGIGSATAQEAKTTQGTAVDLGVMSISLKDAIQPNFGFQGALQGAGTPNQAGIGGFLPLITGDNSVFFLDAQANANFADYNNYSSIINTTVAGTTISTSSRLGYRWLNKDRSWMYGINAGYDSRPLNTGGTDNGVYVTNSRSVFFQQVALNLEAVSNKWFTSAYLLYPIGGYGYNKAPAKINDFYYADSVMTAGVDVGYNLTPNLKASVGYYYSEGDAGAANGNSVKGRLEYNIANGLTSGINVAYDPAFSKGYSSGEFYKTLNLSADLKWRFGANGYGAPSIRKQQPMVMPVIQALSATPANRDVRVHDISDFRRSHGKDCNCRTMDCTRWYCLDGGEDERSELVFYGQWWEYNKYNIIRIPKKPGECFNNVNHAGRWCNTPAHLRQQIHKDIYDSNFNIIDGYPPTGQHNSDTRWHAGQWPDK